MKINFDPTSFVKGLQTELPKMKDPVAFAAKDTMKRFANATQKEVQADAKANGLGNYAKALRVDAYPKGDISVNAAAELADYRPYAEIQEEGGTVVPTGGSFLFLPIKGAPVPKGPGGKVLGPKESHLNLVFIKRDSNKAPLIGVKTRLAGPLSSKNIKKAARNATLTKTGRARKGTKGVRETIVPLWFGIKRATLRARTHLYLIFAKNQADIETFYNAAMDPDRRK